MLSMVISVWLIYIKVKPLSAMKGMTPQNRDNKRDGCSQKGRKRNYDVPGTSVTCNDLNTRTVCLLSIYFILFCFITLFYFVLFYSSVYVTEEKFMKCRRQQRSGFAEAHSEIHKYEWLPEETYRSFY